MKNSFKSILSKEIKNSLFQLNFVKSVTIVGSFNDKNKNLMNVGDIDVVIILDEFNEKKFQIWKAPQNSSQWEDQHSFLFCMRKK